MSIRLDNVNNVPTIDMDGTTIEKDANGALVMNTVQILDTMNANAVVSNTLEIRETVGTNVVAATGEYTLGTLAQPWSNAFVSNMQVDGDLVIGGDILDENGDPVQLDLGNIESNVVAASDQYTLGSTSQPWSNAFVSNIRVDGDLVIGGDILDANGDPVQLDLGNIESNVVAASDQYTLGSATQPWKEGYIETLESTVVTAANIDGNLDANGIYGNIEAGLVIHGELTADAVLSGELDARIVFVGGSIDNITFRSVDGSETEPSITFIENQETGVYRDTDVTGNSVSVTAGGTTRLAIGNDIVAMTNLVPEEDGTVDLGSQAKRWRDIYLGSNSVYLGNTSISEVNRNVVIPNLDVTNITGNGAGLTSLGTPLHLSNIQITDNTWTALDDTALTSNVGGYFQLNGSGFAPGTLCQIDGTNASSTSYVNATTLRVTAPSKPSGSYDVTAIRGDSQFSTLPSAVTYSEGITWVTGTDLGNVTEGSSFTIPIEATSDSNVTYANITDLPPETTLTTTGDLQGNITSVSNDTLYSFDIKATDQEFQEATRTFLLQYIVIPIDLSTMTITYTQSSVYSTNQSATEQYMRDGSFTSSTTQTGTNGSSLEWVMMTFPQEVYINTIDVGSDFNGILAGGWSKFYTENKDVEYSSDGTNWTYLFNTGTFSSGIQTYNAGVYATYIRIVSNGYLAVTEFNVA